MTWNDERVEQLKKLFDAGLSASQIAATLSAPVLGLLISRNAVIGKCNRMGWTRPIKARDSQHSAPRKPRVRTSVNVESIMKAKRQPAFKAEPFIPSADTITPLHLDILHLKPDSCRWPYGEDKITFCGHPAKPDCSYCASHALKAFQKPEKKTQKQFHEQQRQSQRQYRAEAVMNAVGAEAA